MSQGESKMFSKNNKGYIQLAHNVHNSRTNDIYPSVYFLAVMTWVSAHRGKWGQLIPLEK